MAQHAAPLQAYRLRECKSNGRSTGSPVALCDRILGDPAGRPYNFRPFDRMGIMIYWPSGAAGIGTMICHVSPPARICSTVPSALFMKVWGERPARVKV